MIDLRNKGLPNTITVNGSSFLLNTDYREWLKFGVLVDNDCDISELIFLLKDIKPEECCFWTPDTWIEMYRGLVDFYVNPNSTPNQIETSSDKVLDYIEDGEYIYASFLYAYNIDLLETDLHWHKFKALFNSLPDDSKIVSIMQMRGYSPSNKTMAENCAKAKQMWQLKTKVDEELIDEINDLFYNS